MAQQRVIKTPRCLFPLFQLLQERSLDGQFVTSLKICRTQVWSYLHLEQGSAETENTGRISEAFKQE